MVPLICIQVITESSEGLWLRGRLLCCELSLDRLILELALVVHNHQKPDLSQLIGRAGLPPERMEKAELTNAIEARAGLEPML